MRNEELYQLKHTNLMKAINREGANYVPTMVASSCAQIAYTGQKLVDVVGDPEAYAKAMTDVLEEMWCDGNTFAGLLFTPAMEQAIQPLQNYMGPDGITPEHVQLPFMEKDEYDQLAEDPDKFITEVLLPRKYPRFFEDREYAKEALKKIAADKAYALGVLFSASNQRMEEVYGITTICDFTENFNNPFDVIFDYFRGFKGSLIDLRRQPEKVSEACETIWKTFNAGTFAKPPKGFPYGCHMTHIAPYMNPDKFMELYWPYEKKWIEYVAAHGSKVWIMCEGHWDKVWDCFKEVPKDSCVLHIDDDDIIEAKKAIGDYQILEGGLKLADILTGDQDKVKEDIRRVIDACAPGDGFLFCTDKAWICPQDVCPNLIAAYNYAHEYSLSRTQK